MTQKILNALAVVIRSPLIKILFEKLSLGQLGKLVRIEVPDRLQSVSVDSLGNIEDLFKIFDAISYRDFNYVGVDNSVLAKLWQMLKVEDLIAFGLPIKFLESESDKTLQDLIDYKQFEKAMMILFAEINKSHIERI